MTNCAPSRPSSRREGVERSDTGADHGEPGGPAYSAGRQLINPLTMKYTVRIHPVATMIAVLVMGTLMGRIGALIAVPAATAIDLILQEVVFPARDQAQ